ncbi:MAG: hypothetical protein PHE27_03535 [Alphaproteobacteria bacterium]|nr:hypothetical protein [Alphaproteobacteria bacterium]
MRQDENKKPDPAETEFAARKIAFVFAATGILPEVDVLPCDSEAPGFGVFTMPKDRGEAIFFDNLDRAGILFPGVYSGGYFKYDLVKETVTEYDADGEKSRVERIVGQTRTFHIVGTSRPTDIYKKDGKLYMNMSVMQPWALDVAVETSLAIYENNLDEARVSGLPIAKLASPEWKQPMETLIGRAQSAIQTLDPEKDSAEKIESVAQNFENACLDVCTGSGIAKRVDPDEFRRIIFKHAQLRLH